jgi:hypothetical protein
VGSSKGTLPDKRHRYSNMASINVCTDEINASMYSEMI